MAKKFFVDAWRWLKSYRTEAVITGLCLLVIVALATVVVVAVQRNVMAQSLTMEQKAVVSAPAPAPAEVALPVKAAEAAEIAEIEVQQPAVVSVPVSAPREPEIVYTIRQVGGAEEIVKDWHNKNAGKVTLPLIEDLGWEDIFEQDGKPMYLVAVSSNKGLISFEGTDYSFDKGFAAVFITSEAESVQVVTSWNDSAKKEADRHYDMWAEMFVINANMNPDQTAERLLAEWVQEQGKSLGFFVKLDGTVSKMKYEDAVKFNSENDPLFPEQLPQLPAGEKKPIIMTVQQVGASGVIIAEYKNRNATAVTMPVEDKNDWEGILKKDGKPLFIVLISSDDGTVRFEGKDHVFDKGFVAAFITAEPNSIAVSTGWNEDNDNFNVSAQKFVVPSDEDIDEVLKELLEELNKKENKPIVFAILSSGSEYEGK